MTLPKVWVPPIKIQGIKTKLVPLIQKTACITADTIWVEPFMGSGVVGFNIAPERAIFADTNPHLIAFYQHIQEKKITSRLVRSFLELEGRHLAERGDSYYYEVRDRFNELHSPLDFLFLNRSCFNGMIRFNRSLGFNVPFGHKPQRFSKAYITKIVNQVAHIEHVLAQNKWEFRCQDFTQTIATAPPASFIYCDPPYIGRHVDYYDSWDETQEAALHTALTASTHPFMVSTWDHNQYRANGYVNTIWHGCHKVTREHFYHVGAKETNRNPMVEALLTNYLPIPQDTTPAPTAPEQLTLFG